METLCYRLARQLLDFWTRNLRPPGSVPAPTYVAMYCMGIVYGVMTTTGSIHDDAVRLGHHDIERLYPCYTLPLTTGQAIRITTKYLEDHLEELQEKGEVLAGC
jgi:hypothetical protein